jgi:transglutaminase/protease-like cytokinesis protein 3
MLRSQGIPTRLVLGYVGDVYHAWISVHTPDTGWINNIIQFDGKDWRLMDPTFAATGNQGNEVMQFIGTGANHKPAFIH